MTGAILAPRGLAQAYVRSQFFFLRGVTAVLWPFASGPAVVLRGSGVPTSTLRKDVFFASSKIRLDRFSPSKGVLMACCEFSCARW